MEVGVKLVVVTISMYLEDKKSLNDTLLEVQALYGNLLVKVVSIVLILQLHIFLE